VSIARHASGRYLRPAGVQGQGKSGDPDRRRSRRCRLVIGIHAAAGTSFAIRRGIFTGWLVGPSGRSNREGAGPTNHRRKNWPCFQTGGSGHFLDLLDFCWTSAGPMSSKETLEKWGRCCAVWTFWTSLAVAGS
jgi:hypothetical protein